MPRYAITEKAGRFVAAHRNTGVGMVLELTEKQAEHELRLGTLVPLDASSKGPDAAFESAEPPLSEQLPQAAEPAPAAVDVTSEAPRKGRRGKQ